MSSPLLCECAGLRLWTQAHSSTLTQEKHVGKVMLNQNVCIYYHDDVSEDSSLLVIYTGR